MVLDTVVEACIPRWRFFPIFKSKKLAFFIWRNLWYNNVNNNSSKNKHFIFDKIA